MGGLLGDARGQSRFARARHRAAAAFFVGSSAAGTLAAYQTLLDPVRAGIGSAAGDEVSRPWPASTWTPGE